MVAQKQAQKQQRAAAAQQQRQQAVTRFQQRRAAQNTVTADQPRAPRNRFRTSNRSIQVPQSPANPGVNPTAFENRRRGNGMRRARVRQWQQNQENNTRRAAEGGRRWRNRDNSGATNDWQNRSGNEYSRWARQRWRQRHNWDRRHRQRSWWRSNYTRFALFGGGYYYWNGGYWYPAYGYDPTFTTYVYDAPIYAYNDLEPGEVIARVQAQLQRLGYDTGVVDGDFGPATREALMEFQQDNSLPVTGVIDEVTLEALGLE